MYEYVNGKKVRMENYVQPSANTVATEPYAHPHRFHSKEHYGSSGSMAWWVWVLIGVGALVVIIVIVMMMKKGRGRAISSGSEMGEVSQRFGFRFY